jgi:hypothetical protein
MLNFLLSDFLANVISNTVAGLALYLGFHVAYTYTRGDQIATIPETTGKQPMIDLSKETLLFQKNTTAEVRDQLIQELPHRMVVTVKDGKPTQIIIRDGLWRSAHLIIDDNSQLIRLTRIIYDIPSFLALAIIFISSVAVSSIIMTIILSAIIGEFVPVFAGIGGVLGFVMYRLVKRIILAKVKSSWSVELNQILERLKG